MEVINGYKTFTINQTNSILVNFSTNGYNISFKIILIFF